MGKQYNFYISPKQDLEFIKYLFEEGYKIVVPHAFWESDIIKYDHDFEVVEIYNDLDSFMRVQGMHKYDVKIYKEIWGKICINEYSFIDYDKSPLIQYSRCSIQEERNSLVSGRLYLQTYYKDQIESFETINKEYQKLVRVIKKFIAYKDYDFDTGKRISHPSSQEAVDLVNSGYGIL